ncbi:MAG: undecaprenyldiphospho-muramoylpentapeptide beta-N-acetylglucosaminyltransferase [Patescibacteria group bacterium]|jgi:UDP-N-acetylglucosamine--N-acetylmuramyl-(pentapeptide) pyrophosphoryl-undecaprenol N-acetylglucosamine transferase
MRVILSGGGTLGSVSPLIAIYEEIKKNQPQAEFLWLATSDGPEENLISSYQIPLKKIFSGKLRRYFSFKNFLDPFLIFFGFWQSLFIILKFKPQAVLSAGGFVSVPVAWAAWFLRRPLIIHQQDVRPGLANKLMAPFANMITVTFEKSLKDFPAKKTHLVGNPVRADILTGSKEAGYKFFGFKSDLPTILILGGGTGALNLNSLVIESLEELVQFCQVIHLTGGRQQKTAEHPRYRSYDFLTDQMKNAYAIADLVVARAGLGTLTELAALAKPAIIIPIPASHQQDNAVEFFRNNAIAVLDENDLSSQKFFQAIKTLLFDQAELANLSRNIAKMMPKDAAEKITAMIL